MALPYWVAVGTPVYAGSGTISVGAPAGIAADDILILVAGSNAANALAADNGYTELYDTNYVHVYWKRTTGTEGSTSVTGATNSVAAAITAIRGCVTSGSPIGAETPSGASGSGTSITAGSFSTTADDELVLFAFGIRDNNNVSAAAYGNLSGDTGYTSNGTNLGSDTRYGLVRGQMATAGSIGTVTATQSSTDAWQRVVFTLVGAVVTQTHEITLARESTTSVAAVGSVTEGVSTHEIVLALESTTSFTIGGGGYLEGPRGTLFEDFSDTAEYTVGGSGSLSLDTVHVREGLSGHVKLTTATGTACSMARTLPSTVDLSGVNSIELWFYVDAPGYGGTSSYFNMTQTVRLGESSSVYWQRTNHGGNMHPGWNVARWDRSSSANFSANGGISSWANIDYIYFGFTSPTTSAPNGVSITYCTLRAGAMGPRAAFLMTYDDGLESVYNVGRSIVNGLGMHTTAYVSSERVDPGDESTSYMSTAQWQTLASEGHYIGNHTTDHYDLTTLNQTEFDAAVGDCTDYIQAITGLEDHGVHGAYPLGWQNSTVHGYMADLGGQLTWRSVGGVNADGAEAHLWPLSVASQADAEQSSLATWQALIDIAVNTGEAVVALVHDPGNAHYGTSMTTQQFTDVCTYAATTKEMWCPNVDEWWEYAIAPGVGKIDATWEITLGLESTTSVAAAPTEVPGTTTHEITLALESATAVTAAGSITHAVYEVTLSLESLSSVAVDRKSVV